MNEFKCVITPNRQKIRGPRRWVMRVCLHRLHLESFSLDGKPSVGLIKIMPPNFPVLNPPSRHAPANPGAPAGCSTKTRPIKFSGAPKDFDQGVLCFVVARRYQGKGPVRLIMHRAVAGPSPGSFGYGADGHYIVSPATLMGSARSDAKAAAAIRNGRRGGRPKKKSKV